MGSKKSPLLSPTRVHSYIVPLPSSRFLPIQNIRYYFLELLFYPTMFSLQPFPFLISTMLWMSLDHRFFFLSSVAHPYLVSQDPIPFYTYSLKLHGRNAHGVLDFASHRYRGIKNSWYATVQGEPRSKHRVSSAIKESVKTVGLPALRFRSNFHFHFPSWLCTPRL